MGTTRKQTSRNKRNATTPKVCEYPACGYDIIVQRHRITPGNKGGKYILGNVVALCPNHHAEADRGYIDEATLRRIVAERIIREHGEFTELQRSGQLTEAIRDSLTEALGQGAASGNGVSKNGCHSGISQE